jgi:hypothetical protein
MKLNEGDITNAILGVAIRFFDKLTTKEERETIVREIAGLVKDVAKGKYEAK